MTCSISCGLSVAFIISMIYMNNAISTNNVIKDYETQLSPDLRDIYHKIVDERIQIYYTGYILGFVLAIGIIIYNVFWRKQKVSTVSMVCMVVFVSFIVQYFYYILSPKTDWMLNHTKTQHQIQSWLKMYRSMQYYYHFGIVLGLIAVGLFAFAFRC